jgi:4-hydroxybenzoate polyprenyltransferase
LPNENPPPPRFFAETETLLHALQLYGAGGIAAFGWAMGALLGLDAAPWLPLWFCAALLIYNVDRLRPDPADAINLPQRAAACARWRGVIRTVVGLAAGGLVGLPIWRQDWITLTLVLGGSIVCLGYSIPVLGVRWKDVPLVKTLFAPAVVTAAVFGLLARGEIPAWTLLFIRAHPPVFFLFVKAIVLLGLWAFCYLLFNMLLCDIRDRAGDAQCGIRSLPVILGENGARRLLWALAVGGQALLATVLHFSGKGGLPPALLSLCTGLYQAWLLHATRRPRSERFYEWAVEGLLYLPALTIAASRLTQRFIS